MNDLMPALFLSHGSPMNAIEVNDFSQAIDHGTERREQIKSMLRSMGITPPEIYGWAYGTVAQEATPPD